MIAVLVKKVIQVLILSKAPISFRFVNSDLQSLYNLFLNMLKESSIGTSCGLYPGRNIKSIFEIFMVFAACFARWIGQLSSKSTIHLSLNAGVLLIQSSIICKYWQKIEEFTVFWMIAQKYVPFENIHSKMEIDPLDETTLNSLLDPLFL